MLIPFLLVGGGGAIYLGHQSRIDSIIDLEAKNMRTTLVMLAHDIENWQENLRLTVQFLSSDARFISALKEGKAGEDHITQILKSLSDSYTYKLSGGKTLPLYENVFLANADGLLLNLAIGKEQAAGKVDISKIPPYRPNVEAAQKGKTFIGDRDFSPVTGLPVILVTAPILSGDKVIGIVGTPVRMDNFYEVFFSHVTYGKTGYPAWLDKSGKTIAHPEKKFTLKETNLDVTNFDFGKKMLGSSDGMLDYTFQGVRKIGYVYKFGGEKEWRLAAIAPLDEFLEQARREAMSSTFAGGAAILILLVMIFFAASSISKGIRVVADNIKDISEGEADLTQRLQVQTRDEIGYLASSFNALLERLQKIIQDVIENVSTVSASATEMFTIAESMAASAEEMSAQSSSLSNNAHTTQDNMNGVAAAIEQLSNNISTIAAAIEEMSSTVNEISNSAVNSATVASNAEKTIVSVGQLVNQLSEKTKDIDSIVDVIVNISDQTRLLALNATIEAARAGESGKGFAVVAGEVKELAGQTSLSTGDIQKNITEIGDATMQVVNSIQNVVDVIKQVSEMAHGIAASVEEQNATTNEIANNVSQASNATNDVSGNTNQVLSISQDMSNAIQEMSTIAGTTAEGAEQVKTAAKDLSHLSEQLKALVNQFTV